MENGTSQNNDIPLLVDNAGQVKPARVKIKKQHKVKVTAKQRLTAKLVLENTRTPKPMGQILRQAGYSKGISVQPSVVTESKGFKTALLELGVNEDSLAGVFIQGIEANRVDSIKGESVMSNVPDVALRVKTAETVAKLLGYQPQAAPSGNTYNTFIQQNNLDPNDPVNTGIVDNTLDMLMAQTKRK